MSSARTVLICLLVIAVPAQSIAAMGCSCEVQEHAAPVDMPMTSDHMGHDMVGDDLEHGDTHSCDELNADCDCTACSQLPGTTVSKPGLSLYGAGLEKHAIADYTEPVPIPALRPPIQI